MIRGVMRANAPDDMRRETIHTFVAAPWIASSQGLLAMTASGISRLFENRIENSGNKPTVVPDK